MAYSKRLWGAGQCAGELPQLRGSVLLLGLPFSLASSALTLLLHALWRKQLTQRLSGLYLLHVSAVILGFLLVLRCVHSPSKTPALSLSHYT